MYIKATLADPTDTYTWLTYADFLFTKVKDMQAADTGYRKAVEFDINNSYKAQERYTRFIATRAKEISTASGVALDSSLS